MRRGNPTSRENRVLILGLGNPIRGDDGVGNRAALILKEELKDIPVDVEETNATGFNLLEILSGYDMAILIDGVEMGGKPGEIYEIKPEEKGFFYLHLVHIGDVIKMGREMGLKMPEVKIIGVEIKEKGFSEKLSPEVEASVPKVVEIVKKKLGLIP